MKPTAILGVKISNYTGIADLSNRVVAAMSGNLNFTTPSPSLITLTNAQTTLENAIAAWGTVHNRGSHQDLLNCRSAARDLYNLLLQECAYVQNTAQALAGFDYTAMAVIIGSSGYGIKNAPSPQGILGAPQNLHRMYANSISLYTPKLKWSKPTGLRSPNNVKSYQVLRNSTNDILTATVIATATKTSYIDISAMAGSTMYYWVKAVNTDGPGAESAVLQTSTPV